MTIKIKNLQLKEKSFQGSSSLYTNVKWTRDQGNVNEWKNRRLKDQGNVNGWKN